MNRGNDEALAWLDPWGTERRSQHRNPKARARFTLRADLELERDFPVGNFGPNASARAVVQAHEPVTLHRLEGAR